MRKPLGNGGGNHKPGVRVPSATEISKALLAKQYRRYSAVLGCATRQCMRNESGFRTRPESGLVAPHSGTGWLRNAHYCLCSRPWRVAPPFTMIQSTGGYTQQCHPVPIGHLWHYLESSTNENTCVKTCREQLCYPHWLVQYKAIGYLCKQRSCFSFSHVIFCFGCSTAICDVFNVFEQKKFTFWRQRSNPYIVFLT